MKPPVQNPKLNQQPVGRQKPLKPKATSTTPLHIHPKQQRTTAKPTQLILKQTMP
jgi:hypothetical protein